ncbi:type VII secretion protein EccCa [Kineosporia sp. J2-2]|uniref:Type VII secretion protein EccCa n=2 Tax=Kineosporia corallincola TaxID=2835133 RepID=A0ABS5TP24_9ACTN|nr:type VII secretion protein EccCa [Kineosporia corallincola]
MPEGVLPLQEPPVLPEQVPADMSTMVTMLPMGIGGVLMSISFSGAAGSSPMTYLLGGGMGVSMAAMSVGQMLRAPAERRRKLHLERRDYLRYIAQTRAGVRRAGGEQRQALQWNNPDPQLLWSLASGPRLWERRANHEDFAAVRVGVGRRPASLILEPPTTKPIESLEPLSAISLRRFVEAYRTVRDVPMVVNLRQYTGIELAGDLPGALGLVRSIVAQLATFHGPDDLRIAVLAGEGARPDWDWAKWLPHNAHPDLLGETGPRWLVAGDYGEMIDLLGTDVLDRPDHDPGAGPTQNEPFIVLLADRVQVPETSRLYGDGIRNVLMIDVTGKLPGGPKILRLTVNGDQVEYGDPAAPLTARVDGLSTPAVDELARVLAPKRVSGVVDLVDQPLEQDFGLTTLLGIADARRFDVAAQWRSRTPQRARLSVPIGVTEGGEVVELDLKESAQGGMGPHGLLIGATGSGKSELLRTLVLGLAATHSSEILNLVLVDFKGGATFIGMDELPHTSAVITNLADELPLVDRMQDSLNGELNRRQELLRGSGQPSLFEYEKARLAGRQLAPLPTLLVVVDEFSELLASKPEFMDLFVSIGRVGRSLGVHLLLASQRLDEGRINRVEGHLSYRIALRTFSSMESRAVIGAAGAYELPNEPGHGYLKMDTTTLVRFKAAYVSGPAPQSVVREDDESGPAPVAEVHPYYTYDRPDLYLPPTAAPVTVEDVAGQPDPSDKAAGEGTSAEPTLAEVFIGRLRGAGPAARQVWLPPLTTPVPLDALLPGVLPDPVRGMSVPDPSLHGRLRVPLGMVDRPYDQSRELLSADLSGSAGHVAVVGAPQTGKSTLLRTLMIALALTHTPAEVQFYGLDFGGGGLTSISMLPHVGSVAGRRERDRVVRTVEQLFQVMERRETLFTERGVDSMTTYRKLREAGEIEDPYGDVFLVIDGWYTVKNEYADIEPRIGELASRGLSFGVHVMIAATRWSEIRPWLRDLITTRFELRLGDSMESEVGSRKAARVPNRPGHGLTARALPFLAALPRLDGVSGTAELASATRSVAEEIGLFWPGERAPQVRLLPTELPMRELPTDAGNGRRHAIGLDEQRLAPVWHDFDSTGHLMVFGDDETGKTNLLKLLLRSIVAANRPEDVRFILGDPSRQLDLEVPEQLRSGYVVDESSLRALVKQVVGSLSSRVPDQAISAERLARRDWWTGPRLYLVLDDYQLLSGPGGSPLEALLPLMPQGAYIGLHIILARSTSGAMRAMMDPTLRRLWELGTPGVVFGYPKEEGKFLGEAAPRKLPPGRAQLVTRRGVRLIQTGFVPTETPEPETGLKMTGMGL